MQELRQSIEQIYHFTDPNILEEGLKYFNLFEANAKEIALHHGSVCEYLYFPIDSLSRCFYIDESGEEQTLWIKPEMTFVTEYKSFVSQEPSRFSIQFYEEGKVYRIKRKDLINLYKQYSDWAQWGVRLMEHLHVVLIDVFVNLLANDATRNYQYIEYAFPRFIQVAPLKDIASMLQMSQVSLSRIRAGKQTKVDY